MLDNLAYTTYSCASWIFCHILTILAYPGHLGISWKFCCSVDILAYHTVSLGKSFGSKEKQLYKCKASKTQSHN